MPGGHELLEQLPSSRIRYGSADDRPLWDGAVKRTPALWSDPISRPSGGRRAHRAKQRAAAVGTWQWQRLGRAVSSDGGLVIDLAEMRGVG